MVVIVYYYISNVQPQDRFFAVTAGGQKQQMAALREPYVNKALLLEWAAVAATEVLTFGFDDIAPRFAHSRQYFSPEGWESFRVAIAGSDFIKNVTQYKQIVTAIPQAPAVLLAQG